MNAVENLSKICRVCCDRNSNNDLIFLLDAENKTIVKKLRACADITIEQDDLLPKYICAECLQNLNIAYMFKIQCEYMDQKLRTSITSGLQKHATVRITIRNNDDDDDSSWDSDASDEDAVTESFEPNSMHTTMGDLQSFSTDNNNYPRSEPTSSDQCDPNYRTKFNPFDQRNQNHLTTTEPPNQDDPDENAMEVSPTVKAFDSYSLPNTKAANECVDTEMHSIKSDPESLPAVLNRLLRCETCGVNFHIRSEYNRHIKSHVKYRYQCSVCSRWFEKRGQLNVHHKTHSGAKSFRCALCERRYTTQTNLDRHIRVIHKRERQHTCSTCRQTFAQLESLRLHQSVHAAERQFGCDICSQKFKSEVELKSHKKRHLPTEYRLRRKYTPPKKTYKCPPKLCVCTECGKRFTSIAVLRSHMQSHSQVKKYECKFCKKRFAFQQTLRNHIFVHTGEKRFKCDICGISFRQIGHLQVHKLVHSGFKPHSCTFCGKAFALRRNLTNHMRIHTGKASHYCKICPKQFNDSKDLQQHALMHEYTEYRSQTNSNKNPNPSVQQTVETPVKTETTRNFANGEATINQISSSAAPVPTVQWAIDQNAAFQMPTGEPTLENGPGALNPIVRSQTFDDVSKLFFKAD